MSDTTIRNDHTKTSNYLTHYFNEESKTMSYYVE